MQDEGESKPSEGGFDYKNTFWIQFGVVSLAIVVLLIIITYLHFDDNITKFTNDVKNAWKNLKNRTKARIRRKINKTQKSAKRRVMNKIKILQGKTFWKLFYEL